MQHVRVIEDAYGVAHIEAPLAVVASEVGPQFGSDHLPVLTRLALRTAE
nr:hypothetical protein [uncultured Pseudomonas sp.]